MKRYDIKREPNMHDLKTDSEVFQAVISGLKSFEIRFNDRGFKVGDWLHLLETVSTGEEMADGALLEYTGRDYLAVVTHILAGPIYGLKEGWVIMSIESASSDFSLDDDVELATLRAENERLKEDAVYIYNSGYNAGHHDTVEGQYTQVLPVDMRTYQNDVVAEILLEVGYDAARQEEG